MLNFRINAGDTFLKDHLHSAARNTTYTSPDIQNQPIKILRDHIRDTVLNKTCCSLGYILIAVKSLTARTKSSCALS